MATPQRLRTPPGRLSPAVDEGSREFRQVLHNERVFDAALGLAETRLRQGRLQSAVEWCRVAATSAMTNPMRPLRSRDLERLVDAIATAALPASTPLARADGERRVLHVVSEASTIGGHSRLIERWVRRDTGSRSSIVATRQPSLLPALAEAVTASGGIAEGLGADLGDSISRATRLRHLAAEADLVICHLHSDDVVAALAFGAGYHGAPVALYNHADHLFWLGPTQACLVVDARGVGEVLTRQARGYTDAMTYRIVPLVPGPKAGLEKAAARRQVGATADEMIAISVARAVKFMDTRMQPRFSDLMAAALTQNPELALCIVGAAASDEPWPRLREQFGSRIRLQGSVADPQPFLCAADLYLDTFPFSSITSLLEAAALGLPTLTLDAHQGFRRALGVAESVASDADRPTDQAGYLAELHTLVHDPDRRRARGQAAQADYLARASEAQWSSDRERLYTALISAGRSGVRLGSAPVPAPDARQADYALAVLAIELLQPLVTTIAGSLPRFDAAEAAWLSRRRLLARIGRKALGTLHLPAWPADSLIFGVRERGSRDE